MEAEKMSELLRAIWRLKVAITTSSAGPTIEDNQTITGLTMTLAQTPNFTYGVYLNGQRLTVTTDYSISGVTVTFTEALAADKVTVVYKY